MTRYRPELGRSFKTHEDELRFRERNRLPPFDCGCDDSPDPFWWLLAAALGIVCVVCGAYEVLGQ